MLSTSLRGGLGCSDAGARGAARVPMTSTSTPPATVGSMVVRTTVTVGSVMVGSVIGVLSKESSQKSRRTVGRLRLRLVRVVDLRHGVRLRL